MADGSLEPHYRHLSARDRPAVCASRAAWGALAGVTTAHLSPERQQEAQAAVMATMYLHGDSPHHFRNTTQFILGRVA